MALSFDRYLKNKRHTHFIDYLAQANSVISAIALFPQLFGLLRGRTPEGLSVLSFILIASNSCVWLIYGVHRRTPPLIISSAFNAIASIGILTLICVR